MSYYSKLLSGVLLLQASLRCPTTISFSQMSYYSKLLSGVLLLSKLLFGVLLPQDSVWCPNTPRFSQVSYYSKLLSDVIIRFSYVLLLQASLLYVLLLQDTLISSYFTPSFSNVLLLLASIMCLYYSKLR